ncbi:hypothetical protein Y043_6297 [Burkholderia pseudomallei MSHR2138]|nr:hypothetical protein Y043_6297 [Burkholderia pseudomallei MSHR2138]
MNLHFGSTKIFVRLVVCLMVFLASTGCSRAIDHSSENAIAGNESVAQSGDDIMSLKLDALNYTDIPVGTFYVDGVWGVTCFPGSEVAAGASPAVCLYQKSGIRGLASRWSGVTTRCIKKTGNQWLVELYQWRNTANLRVDTCGFCFSRMKESRYMQHRGFRGLQTFPRGCKRQVRHAQEILPC